MADYAGFQIIGRLTADPEIRVTGDGVQILNFTIAMTHKKGVRKGTASFFRAVAFGQIAEVFSKYCAKGSNVFIAGEIQEDRWEDETGQNRSMVKFVVNTVQLLGSPHRAANETTEGKAAADEVPGAFVDPEGEAPF